MENWKIQINNGPVQDFQTKTTVYGLAASASLAQLDFEESEDGPEVVKIWCERMIPEYGPYYYAYDGYATFPVPESSIDW